MLDPIQSTKLAEFLPPSSADISQVIDSLAVEPAPRSDVTVAAEIPVPIAETPQPTAPEIGAEFEASKGAGAQKEEGFIDEAITALRQRLRKTRKPTAVPIVRDKLAIEVEHVMEEGLKEAYRELSPIEREEFKIKGEETASAIRALLRQTHVRVKKIFFLILEWLKLLPGVNRFFLEQEAKIKTDKILALKEIYEKRLH